MKTAIAQQGRANSGKTATVRLIFDALRAEFPESRIEETEGTGKDFRAIVVIGKKRIGFESLGDPSNRRQEHSLALFVKRECCGIVCACRTSGRTVEVVDDLRRHGYTIHWRRRSPLRDEREQHKANRDEVNFAISELRGLLA